MHGQWPHLLPLRLQHGQHVQPLHGWREHAQPARPLHWRAEQPDGQLQSLRYGQRGQRALPEALSNAQLPYELPAC